MTEPAPMSAQPPAPQDEQPETVSPAPHPAAKKLPIPAIIAITAVVGLVIGLAGGIGGMYLYTTPIIDNLRESYSQSEAKAQTLTEQRNELSGQVETLQQQVDELKPQANEGSLGLTILERNVRDTSGTRVVEYIVRNDTNKTLDDIILDFRYLDANDNVVDSMSMSNNASVEPGKTGIVTASSPWKRNGNPPRRKFRWKARPPPSTGNAIPWKSHKTQPWNSNE
ncbi:FxLYD domain-containing protein [Bifidobacterium longum]|uniref:FxLYD domain-containing protein n=1 Tax=Bifidobacterium longum TaxID=216816 RepID=UPI0008F96342|nr:FxLYD domain-containing protein [Bifidobacterium longum]OIN62937.1 hypothetical protein BFS25_07005 [Bifidobacterium longum subsp. infantis]